MRILKDFKIPNLKFPKFKMNDIGNIQELDLKNVSTKETTKKTSKGYTPSEFKDIKEIFERATTLYKDNVCILYKKDHKEPYYEYHIVPNFSTDTIFGQFIHLDQIMEEGARVIEMETACLFKCNEILKRNITALFCVSDNTVINKSVYSGRTDEEEELRHKVRYNIIPNIIVKTFMEMEKE